MKPSPIYHVETCSISSPLQWRLSAFWRHPMEDDGWLKELGKATEPDGIRLLGHRFSKPGISQFTISTKPHVTPQLIVQRVKRPLAILDTQRAAETLAEKFCDSQRRAGHPR